MTPGPAGARGSAVPSGHGMSCNAGRDASRLFASAVLGITTSIAPVFMIATSASMIRQDMPLDEAQLGFLTMAFFGTVAVASVSSGHLVTRIGPARSLRVTALLGAIGLVGIGLFAKTPAQLLIWILVPGLACSISMPAGGAALASLEMRRRSLLFGILQSAAPLASLIAGLLLPTLAGAMGWRGPFLVAATLTVLTAFLPPKGTPGSRRPRPRRDGGGGRRSAGLVLLALAIGLGAAPGVSVGAFLADTVVSGGADPLHAGLLLAVASFAGLFMRAGAPVVAERFAIRLLPATAGMFLMAAVGYALLGVGQRWSWWVLGGVIAYGFGYGWSGLVFYAVVRMRPDAPAYATGVVNAGSAAGASIGPGVFGVVARGSSYTTAWLGAAVVSAVAAMVLRRVSRL
jgi:cyanate permease